MRELSDKTALGVAGGQYFMHAWEEIQRGQEHVQQMLFDGVLVVMVVPVVPVVGCVALAQPRCFAKQKSIEREPLPDVVQAWKQEQEKKKVGVGMSKFADGFFAKHDVQGGTGKEEEGGTTKETKHDEREGTGLYEDGEFDVGKRDGEERGEVKAMVVFDRWVGKEVVFKTSRIDLGFFTRMPGGLPREEQAEAGLVHSLCAVSGGWGGSGSVAVPLSLVVVLRAVDDTLILLALECPAWRE